ncbi:MAG: hypothetical protein RMY62_013325 [Nostoc sp. ZfuVER08]|nr:hypothetical protein [Nostoc sp. ZfuVER08]
MAIALAPTPTPAVSHTTSHSSTHEYQKYLMTFLGEKTAVRVTG